MSESVVARYERIPLLDQLMEVAAMLPEESPHRAAILVDAARLVEVVGEPCFLVSVRLEEVPKGVFAALSSRATR
jgi:hypothetical protein